MNKRLFITTALILLLGVSAANAGFLDWFKSIMSVTGMSNIGTTVPNITVGNTAPVVVNITYQTGLGAGGALSEALPTDIIITYLVMDFDSAGDLDNSTAYLNVSLDGSGYHENSTGTCVPVTEGSNDTAQNYTCTIRMDYWDLSGSWTCAAQSSDGSSAAGKEVTNCFTVGTTTAINITTSALAWATLAVGDLDKLMSTDEENITNTGNTNITSVTLEGINLIGESTNTVWIPAANFTSTWGVRECSTGTALVNDSAQTITGSKLDFGPGSLEFTNNATHVCLEEVGQDLTQQSYSTAGDIEDWTITGVAA